MQKKKNERKKEKKEKRASVPSSSLPPNSGQRLTCPPPLALVERVSGTGNVLESSQSRARRHLTRDSRGSAAQAIPMAGGGFFRPNRSGCKRREGGGWRDKARLGDLLTRLITARKEPKNITEGGIPELNLGRGEGGV